MSSCVKALSLALLSSSVAGARSCAPRRQQLVKSYLFCNMRIEFLNRFSRHLRNCHSSKVLRSVGLELKIQRGDTCVSLAALSRLATCSGLQTRKMENQCFVVDDAKLLQVAKTCPRNRHPLRKQSSRKTTDRRRQRKFRASMCIRDTGPLSTSH